MHPPSQGSNPTQFVFAPPQENEVTFDFWGVLSRRKWLVFLGLVTGLAAGGLYNAQCETVYKSTARVRIEPKEPPKLILGDQRNAFSSSPADFDIRHDQLIGEFNIVQACLFDNQLDKLGSLKDVSDDEKIELVQDNLEITQNREEPIIYEIEYYSKSPEDARTILSTLIATYEKELTEQYQQGTDDIKKLLEEMYSEFSDEYKTKKQQLLEARQATKRLIVAYGDLDADQVRMNQLQTKVAEDQARLMQLDSSLMEAQEAIEAGPEAADDHVFMLIQKNLIKENPYRERDNEAEVSRLEQQIFELEIQLGQQRHLGPGHPEVKTLVNTIGELKKQLATMKQENEQPLGREPIEILRLYAKDLDRDIRGIRASLENDQAIYKELAQRVNQNELNVQTVADLERDLAKISERADIAQAKLIEESSSTRSDRHLGFRFSTTMNATYGEEVWPILPIILGIGALLGSVVGFGLGCLVELADKTFHNPDQIIQQLKVPLIGHIPVISQSKRYLVENSLIEPIVCSYHRPKSHVSEAYRAVRTALYFNTQGKEHSVIQITSPTPGDGKSTLASNLAVSIAQSGKRVLLVDADMRRPRQHGTFGIASKVGFATVLSGQSEWRDTLFECEEIQGLSVMPCGAKPQNPAELSSSPQVKILIEEMRQEFDFVIIDTPPLLAVTDPCPIAARVDGVVLCLRIKKNVRVSAERSVELLANLGAQCIGLVVNGVGAQSGYGSQYTYGAYRAGYSYNGYGYGYGSGYGSGKYYEEDQKGRVANVSGPPRLEEQTQE